jgi:hypothetical protein
VNWVDCVNAFHFDDYRVLDDQIDAVSKSRSFLRRKLRQTDLAGDRDSAFSEFMGETALVTALEKSRAKNRMDMHGRGNDGGGR